MSSYIDIKKNSFLLKICFILPQTHNIEKENSISDFGVRSFKVSKF